MSLDPVTNFARCTVSTGYDAAATSIVLTGGDGAKLPSTFSYNLVWWNFTDYPDPSDDPNREIVRCTGRSTDTLTIVRGQEGISATTKNTGGKTYKMVLAPTKKMIDDIDAHVVSTSNPHSTSDANIVTTDVTTGNVTSAKHGFAPRSDADTTKFLRGGATPAFDNPLCSDVIFNSIGGNQTVCDLLEHSLSTGWFVGGGITVDGTNTVAVAAGEGLIRTTDSPVGELRYVTWAGVTGQSVPANTDRYIYLAYNAGSPVITLAATEPTDLNTNIFLGEAHNVASVISVHSIQRVSGDFAHRIQDWLHAIIGNRVESGSTFYEPAARKIAITAGVCYATNFAPQSVPAFDSNAAGTFTNYYRDGGSGFLTETAQTVWENTKWDANGSLSVMTTGYYANRWVMIAFTGEVGVLYGQAEYATQTAAEKELAPTNVPAQWGFDDHGFYVVQITFQKSASTYASITDIRPRIGGSASSGGSSVHNDLSGLNNGDYKHLTATEYAGTGSGVFAKKTSPVLETPTLGVASATSLATSAATPLLLTNGQLVNIALTAQTVDATTLTIPDFASTVDEFTFKTKSQTMSNKTFVAPALGAATATTVNKVTITQPTTGSTLTIDDGFTLHATGNVTALSGSSTGANTGDSATPAETTTTIGALINGATDKPTPVDADNVAITDSGASHILKKTTWANIKATLKAYFDTLYPSGSGSSTGTNTGDNAANTSSVAHSLATAINDFVVASGAGAFVKKTLAETQTVLGLGSAAYTASTDYAVSAKGVTNGDSHDHAGGDGAQIAYSGLSGLPTLVTTFRQLSDAPASFTGQTLKHVRVNAGETALEFVTLAGGGDMLAANNLSDVASVQTSRANLKIEGMMQSMLSGMVMM